MLNKAFLHFWSFFAKGIFNNINNISEEHAKIAAKIHQIWQKMEKSLVQLDLKSHFSAHFELAKIRLPSLNNSYMYYISFKKNSD